MIQQKFDYSKPELLDFSYVSAAGAPAVQSCFVDCTSDDLCTGDDEI